MSQIDGRLRSFCFLAYLGCFGKITSVEMKALPSSEALRFAQNGNCKPQNGTSPTQTGGQDVTGDTAREKLIDWQRAVRELPVPQNAIKQACTFIRLSEFAVTLDEIKEFRQLDSKTPGHPEYRWTAGVETTTGPLGQGVGNSVGMAIAAKWLAAHYNQSGFEIFNYNVYAVCGDGDMM